ncbi:glycosyltransferase [Candidatus Aerophobetes bacterium]|nr:glycosyltransferase [Candidatus Aerophobetes bacterium]
MRICFVSDQSFPPWGGEGICTQNFCRELRERGHKITVLTSRVKRPPPTKRIRVYRFPSLTFPWRRGPMAFPHPREILTILREDKIQIVHINLPSYLGWQALRAGRRLGIPVVMGFHVQVGNVITSPSSLLFPLKVIISPWFLYFYRRGDFLITPSHFAGTILHQLTRRPYEVVSNGINLREFNPGKISPGKLSDFKREHGLREEPLLLYVGRLSREKNVDYLLKIVEVVRKKGWRARLLIVGEGQLRRHLSERIKKLKMEREIVMTGYLRGEQLLCAYLSADAFLLASRNELQSIATMEAMAMKCPPLIGKGEQNAAQELVREGINGYLFSLEDPEDAADKVIRILSDDTLKRSMREASLEMIQAHNIENSISRLEKIYQKLLARGPVP